MPVAKESQNLTCFLTPFGKYKYLRLPQGYAGFGDRFGLCADPVVKRVGRVVKSVDDILGQCWTIQEVYDTLAEVLSRIIEWGMVVCPKKFLIGTSMKYGGFSLKPVPNGEVQILLDENRLGDLVNVSPPGTKQEYYLS